MCILFPALLCMLCDGALPYMLLKAIDEASCPCNVLGGLSMAMALALANLNIHPKIGRPQMQPARKEA
jgi:hypothetical protein